jgi:N-acetyl-anhydromuramyl-L-alanine amidase AmpD
MIKIPRPANPNGFGPRNGTSITKVVLHTTESTVASALGWFADPEAHVAAHYIVSPDGTVYYCVDERFAAWHAGNYPVNLASLGVECSGHCTDSATWTPALVESVVVLLVDFCERYPGIVPDRKHIIGHAEVPDPKHPGQFGGAGGHTDPGVLIPWDYIIGETQRRLAATAAPENIT